MNEPTPQYAALYQATVKDAAAGGGAIMGKLTAAVRKSLHARVAGARDMRERDVHEESLKHLLVQEPVLRAQYPQVLLEAFNKPVLTAKAPSLSLAEVHFDQLELMDEVQVQESVNMARAQQMAMLVAEASLADLNTLICSTLGLATVRPERNPLRPEIYLQALKHVVERLAVPAAVRLDWLTTMGVSLGGELRELYTSLSQHMRSQGVVAAGYAVVPTPGGGTSGSGSKGVTAQAISSGAPGSAEREALVASEMRAARRVSDPALLTLDRLRRLLAGELDQHGTPHRVAAFAQQFAREFESGGIPMPGADQDFDATMPAALEALTEMKQVDRVVQRLEQRRSAGTLIAPDEKVAHAAREAIRRSAAGIAQALSLEVINLMVDNIARDPRLVTPVQQVVWGLEPALMRLALVDPRIFTDKQHAARVLVQELTHRSLAFTSPQSPGFAEFFQQVQDALAPVVDAAITSAEPFEHALADLRQLWDAQARQQEASRAQAVRALQQAEQRNLLAEKIAREIDSHPDAAKVPEVVIAFLCGPWAQVVAQARLKGGAGSTVADKYQALISATLWSAHPDLARMNVSKLTRLVPLLISTLREGLDTIRYPVTKTSAFLEALMGLHQLAFRAGAKPAEPLAAPVEPAAAGARTRPVEDGDPWVAPEEAHDSNFIELPESAQSTEAVASAGTADNPGAAPTELAVASTGSLPLGSWVELMVGEQWVRTQLTWASPHGTLFLFTSSAGTTQSMTRRTHDKLVAGGQLRVISGQPVVDGALDAVAQQAMRNSVDSTL
ncbi:DUF1631 family protein [Rhodoferax saidenbachensis]|uniref:Thymidine phosphorylase n=1 Tax=Rhodoferax saidenbachensis TaxID=1484693 RepID=A0ABU1ZR32_9BURK|nr:DUF1631 family protein [Rhodoferax saidenbachensis]MDR7308015.1 hypothetical protein [Rhodoferax saidenbachensis]